MNTDDNPVSALARELIRRESVTPEDAGCQQLIAERLAGAGFVAEHLRFGEVDNLWIRHGDTAPLVVFAGHTDVVPPGAIDAWRHPPFAGVIEDDILWGRGAADMKGSVAAMTVACERFVRSNPGHGGSVALLLTSDEEGPAVDGTRRVVETLTGRGEQIDYCIVGEPSCADRLGDRLRIGRRGSLTGHLHVHGRQGHVAYPERARNPIHDALPALVALTDEHWDDGTPHFPPTSFQISNLHAGTGADNVIPGHADIVFNFRYCPASTAEDLRARVRDQLDAAGLNYRLDWRHGGAPFITEPDSLTTVATAAIRAVTGIEPTYSTGGGTSDARFVAPTGAQVIEFGPRNETIHQTDERISVSELRDCAEIYGRLLEALLR